MLSPMWMLILWREVSCSLLHFIHFVICKVTRNNKSHGCGFYCSFISVTLSRNRCSILKTNSVLLQDFVALVKISLLILVSERLSSRMWIETSVIHSRELCRAVETPTLPPTYIDSDKSHPSEVKLSYIKCPSELLTEFDSWVIVWSNYSLLSVLKTTDKFRDCNPLSDAVNRRHINNTEFSLFEILL
jgi:hypothetical protein